jgi:hypothetical protein
MCVVHLEIRTFVFVLFRLTNFLFPCISFSRVAFPLPPPPPPYWRVYRLRDGGDLLRHGDGDERSGLEQSSRIDLPRAFVRFANVDVIRTMTCFRAGIK